MLHCHFRYGNIITKFKLKKHGKGIQHLLEQSLIGNSKLKLNFHLISI